MKKMLLLVPAALCLFACGGEEESNIEQLSNEQLAEALNQTSENITKDGNFMYVEMTYNFMDTVTGNVVLYSDPVAQNLHMISTGTSMQDIDNDSVIEPITVVLESVVVVEESKMKIYAKEETVCPAELSEYNRKNESLTIQDNMMDEMTAAGNMYNPLMLSQLGINFETVKTGDTIKSTLDLSTINLAMYSELLEGMMSSISDDSLVDSSSTISSLSGKIEIEIKTANIKVTSKDVIISISNSTTSAQFSMPISFNLEVKSSNDSSKFVIPDVDPENIIDNSTK